MSEYLNRDFWNGVCACLLCQAGFVIVIVSIISNRKQ